MFEISDMQKIGVGLAGFGSTFLLLGVLLLFDKGLLAIGNVRFLDFFFNSSPDFELFKHNFTLRDELEKLKINLK